MSSVSTRGDPQRQSFPAVPPVEPAWLQLQPGRPTRTPPAAVVDCAVREQPTSRWAGSADARVCGVPTMWRLWRCGVARETDNTARTCDEGSFCDGIAVSLSVTPTGHPSLVRSLPRMDSSLRSSAAGFRPSMLPCLFECCNPVFPAHGPFGGASRALVMFLAAGVWSSGALLDRELLWQLDRYAGSTRELCGHAFSCV